MPQALPEVADSVSLLTADVQPHHRASGFADDRITIAAPATFELGFGREIASQDSKQDSKNNQACNRQQHRIVKTHGRTVVRSHWLVKRLRLLSRVTNPITEWQPT